MKDKVIKIEKKPIKISLIFQEANAVNIKHVIDEVTQITILKVFSKNRGMLFVLCMLLPWISFMTLVTTKTSVSISFVLFPF